MSRHRDIEISKYRDIEISRHRNIEKEKERKMRNTTISICKALAIILMVIGHAEAPTRLHYFIYEFHMPVFFIVSGYFFSTKYVYREAEFVRKRVRGLYWPFVKWSVVFLALHNLMFRIGILNEVYGNASGGVTHPLSSHQLQQSLWNIVTAMGGYDQFLCGAFWFFRALFVASILYLIIYIIVEKTTRRLLSPLVVAVIATLIPFLLAGWKTYEGLRIINLVQGGYRDLMGCFFFGIGFLFRQLEPKYNPRWYLSLVYAAIVYLFSVYLTANMNWRSTYTQYLSLPVPAILGFLLTYDISRFIDSRRGCIKNFLVYLGDRTLYIFIFHIISFKLVSLIKIWYYGLDPRQIGCHMVIHDYSGEDCFWILYTVAGVGIPLFGRWCYENLVDTVRARRASSASPSR